MLIGTLIGCTTVPPRDSPWVNIEPATGDVTQPRALSDLPNLIDTGSGIQMTYEGFDELERYMVISEGNLVTARNNTIALEEMRQGYNNMVEAGQAEFELGELRLQMLAEERSARLWDKILFGTIAVLGVAIGLSN